MKHFIIWFLLVGLIYFGLILRTSWDDLKKNIRTDFLFTIQVVFSCIICWPFYLTYTLISSVRHSYKNNKKS